MDLQGPTASSQSGWMALAPDVLLRLGEWDGTTEGPQKLDATPAKGGREHFCHLAEAGLVRQIRLSHGKIVTFPASLSL